MLIHHCSNVALDQYWAKKTKQKDDQSHGKVVHWFDNDIWRCLLKGWDWMGWACRSGQCWQKIVGVALILCMYFGLICTLCECFHLRECMWCWHWHLSRRCRCWTYSEGLRRQPLIRTLTPPKALPSLDADYGRRDWGYLLCDNSGSWDWSLVWELAIRSKSRHAHNVTLLHQKQHYQALSSGNIK